MDNNVKIFINPKFQSAPSKIHINPNFLQKKTPTIHYNPKFLIQEPKYEQEIIEVPAVAVAQKQPAIKNTKNKLIRAPASVSKSDQKLSFSASAPKASELIKISKTKLIRASKLIEKQHQQNEIIKKAIKDDVKKKKIKRAESSSNSIYKLDRRFDAIRKKKIVSRYSIKRFDSSETLSPKKVIIKDMRLLKIGKSMSSSSTAKASPNKQLVMININGVLYKSSTNKLQKSVLDPRSSNDYPAPGSSNERSLFVRGERFILDASGLRLKREKNSKLKMSRIDIGGLTYKASSNGAFERDNSHQVRSHISSIKQRSITVLSSKLTKVNIICPIYRRLGKCMAHKSGRCPKTHDRNYVNICPLFLRGKCENFNCLLSHDASLAKMPVCRFYLEGLCNKDDCLYLHKKLSDKTKLCPEFLKGFCSLADKCDLRHELLENTHVKKNKARKPHIPKVGPANLDEPESSDKRRYFVEDSPENQSATENVPKRHKLGALPSYIPL